MADLPYGIYEGEVVGVSPNNYSALVDISFISGTEAPPVLCALLMQHGGSSDQQHSVSIPMIGSRVMVISAMGSSIPVIAGYLAGSSLASEPTRAQQEEDPLSANFNSMDFRGTGPDDLLPGDYSLISGSARLVVQGNSGVEVTSSSGGLVSVTDCFGISRVTTKAQEIHTVTPLYTSRLTAPNNSAPQLVMEALTTSEVADGPLGSSTSSASDLQVIMGAGVPLKISYTGAGSNSSGFEIAADGTVRIRGSRVEIDNYGGVTAQSLGIPDKFEGDINLRTDSALVLDANSVGIEAASNIAVTSGNSLTVSSKQVTITSDSKNGIPTPGTDHSMVMRALGGGIKIEAGAELPTPNTVTKPGVRIQSANGGDIHLVSRVTAGGLGTSGAVVLSSSLPVSFAGSGGLGNYGIVLNSPFVFAGNYPGIEDTPEGILSPWAPPVPPLVDSYPKHFQYMLTLTAQVAATAAGLAATFPPLGGAAGSAYASVMAPLIALSASPSIGRPISFVGSN